MSIRDGLDKCDFEVSDAMNLMMALQIVMYELAGITIDDEGGRTVRSAAIGVADALEGKLKAVQQAVQHLYSITKGGQA